MLAIISSLRARSPAGPSLTPLFDVCDPGIGAVNHVIFERMHSPVALIPELAAHLIAGGGKRLRPPLTLACAIAFQLVDNAMDCVADADIMGRDVGNDFRDGSGAAADTLAPARNMARTADALAGFTANPARPALLETVEFALSRTS